MTARAVVYKVWRGERSWCWEVRRRGTVGAPLADGEATNQERAEKEARRAVKAQRAKSAAEWRTP